MPGERAAFLAVRLPLAAFGRVERAFVHAPDDFNVPVEDIAQAKRKDFAGPQPLKYRQTED